MDRKISATYSEENPSPIQDSENKNLQNSEFSSFRIIASQFVAVFPIIFIKLRYGIGLGFTTVFIPILKKNAEIDVTLDELTWFSSYCFVIPVASISGGLIAQYISVRQLFIFSYLLYISADLLFHWSNSTAMILLAQVIVGLAGGISQGPCFTYVAEIVQPKFRSISMAALSLSVYFGRFFAILLGNFLYWRVQIFFHLVFPLIGFIFIYVVPDSPQWLASKNRFEEAEKSLARLRGWTTTEAVKAELHSSVINTSLSLTKTTLENNSPTQKWTKFKNGLSLYLDRSFYIPFLTVTTLIFFAEFNGGNGLLIFSGLIFREIKSPIDERIGSVIFSVLSVVASFVYIFSVGFLGKRILALASVFIIIVCLIIAVILLYLTNNNLIASEIYSWIILIALITTTFAHIFGLGKIIFFVNSELFPQKLRYVGAGIGFFMYNIMDAILGKIFLYIVNAITFPGTLIVFIIINIIGFIVIYFILPETEGVTLQQIEKHYTSTNKNKPYEINVHN